VQGRSPPSGPASTRGVQQRHANICQTGWLGDTAGGSEVGLDFAGQGRQVWVLLFHIMQVIFATVTPIIRLQ
jgi:hypothetical protein